MSVLIECKIDFANDTVALYVERALVEKLRGNRIEIRLNEHSPPHFHVVGADYDASFKIENCEHLNGNISARDLRYIRYWFFEMGAKKKLIEFWNSSRPSNCPVGPIV
ncbi:MAG: DUF4160 domain-containing protein [Chloracidobacterium sp.]|nr:DUF4160 domain-containing protein [Chloracidobacterium sp.]